MILARSFEGMFFGGRVFARSAGSRAAVCRFCHVEIMRDVRETGRVTDGQDVAAKTGAIAKWCVASWGAARRH